MSAILDGSTDLSADGLVVPSGYRTPVTSAATDAWVQAWLRAAAIHEQLYRVNPWVRICVGLIVQAATADEAAYENDPGQDQRTEALRTVHANLNPQQSFQRLLRMLYRDLLVHGNWYARVQRAADGSFAALYRVDFRTIVPMPSPIGQPETYLFFRNGRLSLSPDAIPADEVLHFTLNDDAENGCGLSYLETLDRTLATDYAQQRYAAGFFQNGAKAGDIYALDTDWDEKRVQSERQYLKDNFSSVEQAMEPLFIPGKLKLLRDGSSLKPDMPFLQGRQWNREEVAGMYSVPLSLITAQMGTLGGNGKEQDLLLFDESVVAPLQKQVYEDWQRLFVEGTLGAEGVRVVAPLVTKMRLDKLAAAVQLLNIGGTGNQALGAVNLPPVEGLDRPLFFPARMPMGIVGVPGDPDSVLLTAKGAMSAEIQDPLALSGQSLEQLQVKQQTAQAAASSGLPGQTGPGGAGAAASADVHAPGEQVPAAVRKAGPDSMPGEDWPEWARALVADTARRVLEHASAQRDVIERHIGARQ